MIEFVGQQDRQPLDLLRLDRGIVRGDVPREISDLLRHFITLEFEGDQPLTQALVMETSMRLHLRPELRHMERLVDHAPARVPGYELWSYDVEIVPTDGVLDTATAATAAKGKQFLHAYVSSFTRHCSRRLAIAEICGLVP